MRKIKFWWRQYQYISTSCRLRQLAPSPNSKTSARMSNFGNLGYAIRYSRRDQPNSQATQKNQAVRNRHQTTRGLIENRLSSETLGHLRRRTLGQTWAHNDDRRPVNHSVRESSRFSKIPGSPESLVRFRNLGFRIPDLGFWRPRDSIFPKQYISGPGPDVSGVCYRRGVAQEPLQAVPEPPALSDQSRKNRFPGNLGILGEILSLSTAFFETVSRGVISARNKNCKFGTKIHENFDPIFENFSIRQGVRFRDLSGFSDSGYRLVLPVWVGPLLESGVMENPTCRNRTPRFPEAPNFNPTLFSSSTALRPEIGRASCRERVLDGV